MSSEWLFIGGVCRSRHDTLVMSLSSRLNSSLTLNVFGSERLNREHDTVGFDSLLGSGACVCVYVCSVVFLIENAAQEQKL